MLRPKLFKLTEVLFVDEKAAEYLIGHKSTKTISSQFHVAVGQTHGVPNRDDCKWLCRNNRRLIGSLNTLDVSALTVCSESHTFITV